MIDNIPTIFDKSQFEVLFKNGGTFLLSNDKEVTPIAHDDKGTLYVLNGAGNDFLMYNIFKSYDIDNKRKEIVIYKNIVNFNQGQKSYYQFIKIPKDSYIGIVVQDKIKIRIKFVFLNDFELMEYDFKDRTFTTIQTVSQGK